MTTWGFADCQRQRLGAGFGSTLGRLFLRTLPSEYNADSVYTWFPLVTPAAMKIHLTKLGIDKYNLMRPVTQIMPRIVSGYTEVSEILKSTASFHHPYTSAKPVSGHSKLKFP